MFLFLIVPKDYQYNPHFDKTASSCLWTLHTASSFQKPDLAVLERCSLPYIRVLKLYEVLFDQLIVGNGAEFLICSGSIFGYLIKNKILFLNLLIPT